MKNLIVNGLITMVIGSLGTVVVAWVLDYGKLKDDERARIETEVAVDYERKIIKIVEDSRKSNEALRSELKTSLAITKELILHDNQLTIQAIELITNDSSLITPFELDSIYQEMLKQ